jgi:fermentation-respiration switch protein FrsA (DUF1100 family)
VSPQMNRKVLCTVLIVFFFSTGCSSYFFYPQKPLFENPVARRFSPEDIWFTASDGIKLHGWFFRPPAAAPKGSILVLHGNAENLSTHVNTVLWLAQAGYNLFIFDYRGYGRSQGRPTVAGVHIDSEAALDTLLMMVPKEEKIIVLGQSIGGAIAVYTTVHAQNRSRIAALVIDSAFSGYRLIAREKISLITSQCCLSLPFQYPLSFLVSDNYSPIKFIGRVSPVPLVIIQGTEDPVVPSSHGKKLFESAGEPKEFWEASAPGHIRSFSDALIRQKLLDYLERQIEAIP